MKRYTPWIEYPQFMPDDESVNILITMGESKRGTWCKWSDVSPHLEREESTRRILHGPGTSDEKLQKITETLL